MSYARKSGGSIGDVSENSYSDDVRARELEASVLTKGALALKKCKGQLGR